MGPINYQQIQRPDLSGAFQQGIQQVRQEQFEEGQRQLATDQLARQQAFHSRLEGLADDSSPAAIQKLYLEFPEMSDQLKSGMEMMDERERKIHRNLATPIYSAVSTGSIEIAKKKALQAAKLFRDAGDEETAMLYDSLGEQLAGDNAKGAEVQMGLIMHELVGAEEFKKFAELRKTTEEAETEEAGRGAEIAKTEAETEEIKTKTELAERETAVKEGQLEARKTELAQEKELAEKNLKLAMDRMKIDQEKMDALPESSMKRVNEKSDQIGKFQEQRAQADNLIKMAGGVPDATGALSLAESSVRNFLGDRTKVERFRTEANRFVTKDLVDNLPPGAASENDVKMLRKGFPPIDASVQEWTDYLQMVSRVAQAKERANDVAIKFISENKYEGKARKAFDIDGVEVKKGETLTDFLKRTRDDVYSGVAGQDSQEGLDTDAPEWFNAGGTPGYFGKY